MIDTIRLERIIHEATTDGKLLHHTVAERYPPDSVMTFISYISPAVDEATILVRLEWTIPASATFEVFLRYKWFEYIAKRLTNHGKSEGIDFFSIPNDFESGVTVSTHKALTLWGVATIVAQATKKG